MLFDFIKERMKSYPQQTVSDAEATVTYEELIKRAERLAAKLGGRIYALLCDSELNTAVGLLACMCAEKTAVPLSAKYGAHHYEKIIEHIQPDGIISDKEIHQTKYSNNDSLKDTAVIMCSSGTTGMPKGIMLSEQNLLTNLLDIEKYMPINSNDYMLISRPIYHCAVMTSELLYGLIRGASILFYNNNLNPKRLYRIIEVLAYGQKDNFAGERIALKVVSNNLSISDIFRICRDKLPSFQYPDRIELVDSLEHTASGKLVRGVYND